MQTIVRGLFHGSVQQTMMSHTKYATISFHMSISHSVMHWHGCCVICVPNQHGFKGVCFESSSFTLFAIIGSILCAELIDILCSLQIAYVCTVFVL